MAIPQLIAGKDAIDKLWAAISTKLSGKQDKLTAGTNISINSSNNTISTSAEVNQNAFSNVTVGSTTIAADSKTDTLTLAAGSNITLTPDATNDKVTIAATNTNTTYTFSNGTNGFTVTPSGGSAQTVSVTPSISNNVTGSGTDGYIAKFNGGNTITNGPQIGSSTSTFLRNDGSWATPPGTYSLPTASTSTLGGVKVDGSTITINNGVISGAASSNYTTCTLQKFTAAGSKAVTISGVTANSHPVLDVVTSTTASTAKNQIADWSHIYAAVTSANTITFYSDGATTQTSITVSVKDY